ncbi:hypothetical protein BESB_063040 [Besnoitia besnoiti]|uniref:Uncharacterized protein n=1 Tax=Besnoitia besnoiti TaxID=94643 RepID=A0A2A9MIK4_BESBE|nr:hypothetical protein BESB_063040 [Besnoitia besnoiti]PFH35417.1 hypothetical protein BESB_063040 [Besnoitia besnoiti]
MGPPEASPPPPKAPPWGSSADLSSSLFASSFAVDPAETSALAPPARRGSRRRASSHFSPPSPFSTSYSESGEEGEDAEARAAQTGSGSALSLLSAIQKEINRHPLIDCGHSSSSPLTPRSPVTPQADTCDAPSSSSSSAAAAVAPSALVFSFSSSPCSVSLATLLASSSAPMRPLPASAASLFASVPSATPPSRVSTRPPPASGGAALHAAPESPRGADRGERSVRFAFEEVSLEAAQEPSALKASEDRSFAVVAGSSLHQSDLIGSAEPDPDGRGRERREPAEGTADSEKTLLRLQLARLRVSLQAKEADLEQERARSADLQRELERSVTLLCEQRESGAPGAAGQSDGDRDGSDLPSSSSSSFLLLRKLEDKQRDQLLRAKIAEASELAEVLQAYKVNTRATTAALQDELEVAYQKMQEVETIAAARGRRVAQLEAELAALRETFSALQKELSGRASASAAREATLAEALEACATQIASLERERETTELRLKREEEKNSLLAKAQDAVRELQTELDEARRSLASVGCLSALSVRGGAFAGSTERGALRAPGEELREAEDGLLPPAHDFLLHLEREEWAGLRRSLESELQATAAALADEREETNRVRGALEASERQLLACEDAKARTLEDVEARERVWAAEREEERRHWETYRTHLSETFRAETQRLKECLAETRLAFERERELAAAEMREKDAALVAMQTRAQELERLQAESASWAAREQQRLEASLRTREAELDTAEAWRREGLGEKELLERRVREEQQKVSALHAELSAKEDERRQAVAQQREGERERHACELRLREREDEIRALQEAVRERDAREQDAAESQGESERGETREGEGTVACATRQQEEGATPRSERNAHEEAIEDREAVEETLRAQEQQLASLKEEMERREVELAGVIEGLEAKHRHLQAQYAAMSCLNRELADRVNGLLPFLAEGRDPQGEAAEGEAPERARDVEPGNDLTHAGYVKDAMRHIKAVLERSEAFFEKGASDENAGRDTSDARDSRPSATTLFSSFSSLALSSGSSSPSCLAMSSALQPPAALPPRGARGAGSNTPPPPPSPSSAAAFSFTASSSRLDVQRRRARELLDASSLSSSWTSGRAEARCASGFLWGSEDDARGEGAFSMSLSEKGPLMTLSSGSGLHQRAADLLTHLEREILRSRELAHAASSLPANSQVRLLEADAARLGEGQGELLRSGDGGEAAAAALSSSSPRGGVLLWALGELRALLDRRDREETQDSAESPRPAEGDPAETQGEGKAAGMRREAEGREEGLEAAAAGACEAEGDSTARAAELIRAERGDRERAARAISRSRPPPRMEPVESRLLPLLRAELDCMRVKLHLAEEERREKENDVRALLAELSRASAGLATAASLSAALDASLVLPPAPVPVDAFCQTKKVLKDAFLSQSLQQAARARGGPRQADGATQTEPGGPPEAGEGDVAAGGGEAHATREPAAAVCSAAQTEGRWLFEFFSAECLGPRSVEAARPPPLDTRVCAAQASGVLSEEDAALKEGEEAGEAGRAFSVRLIHAGTLREAETQTDPLSLAGAAPALARASVRHVKLQCSRWAGLDAERAGLDAERAGLDAERAGLDAERAGLDAERAGLDAERARPLGDGERPREAARPSGDGKRKRTRQGRGGRLAEDEAWRGGAARPAEAEEEEAEATTEPGDSDWGERDDDGDDRRVFDSEGDSGEGSDAWSDFRADEKSSALALYLAPLSKDSHGGCGARPDGEEARRQGRLAPARRRDRLERSRSRGAGRRRGCSTSSSLASDKQRHPGRNHEPARGPAEAKCGSGDAWRSRAVNWRLEAPSRAAQRAERVRGGGRAPAADHERQRRPRERSWSAASGCASERGGRRTSRRKSASHSQSTGASRGTRNRDPPRADCGRRRRRGCRGLSRSPSLPRRERRREARCASSSSSASSSASTSVGSPQLPRGRRRRESVELLVDLLKEVDGLRGPAAPARGFARPRKTPRAAASRNSSPASLVSASSSRASLSSASPRAADGARRGARQSARRATASRAASAGLRPTSRGAEGRRSATPARRGGERGDRVRWWRDCEDEEELLARLRRHEDAELRYAFATHDAPAAGWRRAGERVAPRRTTAAASEEEKGFADAEPQPRCVSTLPRGGVRVRVQLLSGGSAESPSAACPQTRRSILCAACGEGTLALQAADAAEATRGAPSGRRPGGAMRSPTRSGSSAALGARRAAESPRLRGSRESEGLALSERASLILVAASEAGDALPCVFVAAQSLAPPQPAGVPRAAGPLRVDRGTSPAAAPAAPDAPDAEEETQRLATRVADLQQELKCREVALLLLEEETREEIAREEKRRRDAESRLRARESELAKLQRERDAEAEREAALERRHQEVQGLLERVARLRGRSLTRAVQADEAERGEPSGLEDRDAHRGGGEQQDDEGEGRRKASPTRRPLFEEASHTTGMRNAPPPASKESDDEGAGARDRGLWCARCQREARQPGAETGADDEEKSAAPRGNCSSDESGEERRKQLEEDLRLLKELLAKREARLAALEAEMTAVCAERQECRDRCCDLQAELYALQQASERRCTRLLEQLEREKGAFLSASSAASVALKHAEEKLRLAVEAQATREREIEDELAVERTRRLEAREEERHREHARRRKEADDLREALAKERLEKASWRQRGEAAEKKQRELEATCAKQMEKIEGLHQWQQRETHSLREERERSAQALEEARTQLEVDFRQRLEAQAAEFAERQARLQDTVEALQRLQGEQTLQAERLREQEREAGAAKVQREKEKVARLEDALREMRRERTISQDLERDLRSELQMQREEGELLALEAIEMRSRADRREKEKRRLNLLRIRKAVALVEKHHSLITHLAHALRALQRREAAEKEPARPLPQADARDATQSSDAQSQARESSEGAAGGRAERRRAKLLSDLLCRTACALEEAEAELRTLRAELKACRRVGADAAVSAEDAGEPGASTDGTEGTEDAQFGGALQRSRGRGSPAGQRSHSALPGLEFASSPCSSPASRKQLRSASAHLPASATSAPRRAGAGGLLTGERQPAEAACGQCVELQRELETLRISWQCLFEESERVARAREEAEKKARESASEARQQAEACARQLEETEERLQYFATQISEQKQLLKQYELHGQQQARLLGEQRKELTRTRRDLAQLSAPGGSGAEADAAQDSSWRASLERHSDIVLVFVLEALRQYAAFFNAPATRAPRASRMLGSSKTERDGRRRGSSLPSLSAGRRALRAPAAAAVAGQTGELQEPPARRRRSASAVLGTQTPGAGAAPNASFRADNGGNAATEERHGKLLSPLPSPIALQATFLSSLRALQLDGDSESRRWSPPPLKLAAGAWEGGTSSPAKSVVSAASRRLSLEFSASEPLTSSSALSACTGSSHYSCSRPFAGSPPAAFSFSPKELLRLKEIIGGIHGLVLCVAASTCVWMRRKWRLREILYAMKEQVAKRRAEEGAAGTRGEYADSLRASRRARNDDRAWRGGAGKGVHPCDKRESTGELTARREEEREERSTHRGAANPPCALNPPSLFLSADEPRGARRDGSCPRGRESDTAEAESCVSSWSSSDSAASAGRTYTSPGATLSSTADSPRRRSLSRRLSASPSPRATTMQSPSPSSPPAAAAASSSSCSTPSPVFLSLPSALPHPPPLSSASSLASSASLRLPVAPSLFRVGESQTEEEETPYFPALVGFEGNSSESSAASSSHADEASSAFASSGVASSFASAASPSPLASSSAPSFASAPVSLLALPPDRRRLTPSERGGADAPRRSAHALAAAAAAEAAEAAAPQADEGRLAWERGHRRAQSGSEWRSAEAASEDRLSEDSREAPTGGLGREVESGQGFAERRLALGDLMSSSEAEWSLDTGAAAVATRGGTRERRL